MTVHNLASGSRDWGGEQAVACSATLADCDWLDIRGMNHGSIVNEGAATLTINWLAAMNANDTPRALKTAAGAAVQTVLVKQEVWDLPPEIAGVAFLIPQLGASAGVVKVHVSNA